MSGIKKILTMSAFILLIMAMLIGCPMLLKDSTIKSGQYIELNIARNTVAKAITVTEYDVTKLEIKIYDPQDLLIEDFSWYPDEEEQSYLIPITEEGDYEIVVTHISENNGTVVEAVESSSFNIGAMVITAINIIPGLIGYIDIIPEDVEPSDPLDWLYGYWFYDTPYCAPYSEPMEIREDGTWYWYENYDGSGEVTQSGIWYVEEGVFIIVMGGTSMEPEIIKISNDEFIFVMMGEESHFYKRGSNSCYWVFDQSPEVLTLSVGEWTDGNISPLEIQLFSFQSSMSGTYSFYLKQLGNPDIPVYDADVVYSAYREDQETVIAEPEEFDGYWDPITVFLETDETVYILVDAWFDGGSFGLRVLQQ